ncbi:unnamed protein product [Caenorhabditis auriculariae]|uniref:TPM domain-containing protein n=1 Tax=Caenorhabditis auriculariae TaxID=2777116 RepID=A0A8S1GW05_9PELO|nr:unnamed protein product [Caenorhabditis auriculariae]
MRWLLLALCATAVWAQQWDAVNFPNPTAGQFKQCKMLTTANICDPDEVLTEQARYRLDHDLKQLESRTRQDGGRTFCDKKGVTAAMAVARRVKGGSTEEVKRMANEMLQRWTLDQQCQKAVVIVVSTEDKKFFTQQKALFQQNNYQQALTNILQATWEKALSKQGRPSTTGGGGFKPQPPPTGGDRDSKPSSGFKFPSIPMWLWLFLIMALLGLCCCVGCCYCCCCRGRGSSGGNHPQPVPTGGGYDMGGGGVHSGGGGGIGNFFRSAAGGGAGAMIGNMLSKRGRGGNSGGMSGNSGYGMGGAGAYQGGGSYPDGPQPVYDDNQGEGGKGLYPSKAVKDEGGGGSWA